MLSMMSLFLCPPEKLVSYLALGSSYLLYVCFLYPLEVSEDRDQVPFTSESPIEVHGTNKSSSGD